MDISAVELRRTMARFATGVTVVASRDPRSGSPRGLTANAVCSVSLDPPLVLVCLAKSGGTASAIRDAQHFSINVLSEDQREISRVFADREAGDRFGSVAYGFGETGAPVLLDAMAALECRLWSSYPGGDHTIFVGRVVRAYEGERHVRPLLFFEGDYSSIEGAARPPAALRSVS